MITLGVNIDHIASLRQARYRDPHHARGHSPGEPDPVLASYEAELGGADCITVHLREDRRHINDRDLELLARVVRGKLNLEMAATDDMVKIATTLAPRPPQMATLVPEGRQEVTTEGGLDVKGQLERMKNIVKRLQGAGIQVSAFIDADVTQVEASAQAGFHAVEIHTGPYAKLYGDAGGQIDTHDLSAELEAVAIAGARARAAGLRFNAGHALDYLNVVRIAGLPGICELHIGHAIMARAMFTGLRQAVRDMKSLIVQAHRRG